MFRCTRLLKYSIHFLKIQWVEFFYFLKLIQNDQTVQPYFLPSNRTQERDQEVPIIKARGVTQCTPLHLHSTWRARAVGRPLSSLNTSNLILNFRLQTHFEKKRSGVPLLFIWPASMKYVLKWAPSCDMFNTVDFCFRHLVSPWRALTRR